mgnify:CR=1 FL=1
MTASLQCQIMDALATILTGMPDVDTFITDSERVMSAPDGVTVSLDMDGSSTDQIAKTCNIHTTLPIIVTVYSTRQPNDPPNWQILDPFYVELHSRIMSDRRLGGLALDITAEGRTSTATIKACALGCRYSVKYQTRQEDVTLQ